MHLRHAAGVVVLTTSLMFAAASPSSGSSPLNQANYDVDAGANHLAVTTATSVKRVLLDSAKESFGGVHVDSGGLVVSLVAGPGFAYAERITREVETLVPMRIKNVRHSLAQLGSWKEEVAENYDRLSASGVTIVSIAPDVPTNSVLVALRGYTTEAEATLRGAFPSIPISIERANGEPGPGGEGGTRAVDVAPWWGGSRITSPSETCSSGFTVVDENFFLYMISAAHCATGRGVTVRQAQGLWAL